MMKAHCDNCDALIHHVDISKRVTVQPWGYDCNVTVTIQKSGMLQTLCADCLHAAVLTFAATLEITLKSGVFRVVSQ